MASIKELIEFAGSVDPSTVEVVWEIEEFNHDCFPLAKDWSGKIWLIQQESNSMPDITTERDMLRFIAEQRVTLPEWKRSWLFGPSYQVSIIKDQPPTAQLLEGHFGLWRFLRYVEPENQGIWDTITWRRLNTDTNLLGQYQVGDGQRSTMVKVS